MKGRLNECDYLCEVCTRRTCRDTDPSPAEDLDICAQCFADRAETPC